MKLSKAINTFHIGLSLYIAGGWMLSYIHNRILLLLIPLMYVNWLIDDNKCIFTRLEYHYKDDKDDNNKEKGFIVTKLNNMGIKITEKQTHIILTLISFHTYIQCYHNIVVIN